MTNPNAPHDAAQSDHMSLDDVRGYYRGASRAWVYSNVAKGILPSPHKVGGRSFWSRREIETFDAKRREAQREAA